MLKNFFIVALSILSIFLFIDSKYPIASWNTTIFTFISSLGTLSLAILTLISYLNTKKQRFEDKKPIVTLQLIPENNKSQNIDFHLTNTGGGPAYNLTIKFTPNEKYGETYLNELPLFKNLPVLELNDSKKFFYASAIDVMEESERHLLKGMATYYNKPEENKYRKKFTREFSLSVNEYKFLQYVGDPGFNELVTEIREFKQAVILANVNNEE